MNILKIILSDLGEELSESKEIFYKLIESISTTFLIFLTSFSILAINPDRPLNQWSFYFILAAGMIYMLLHIIDSSTLMKKGAKKRHFLAVYIRIGLFGILSLFLFYGVALAAILSVSPGLERVSEVYKQKKSCDMEIYPQDRKILLLNNE